MAGDEDEGDPECAAEVVDVGETPCQAREEQEEGEEVGEGWVWAVVG